MAFGAVARLVEVALDSIIACVLVIESIPMAGSRKRFATTVCARMSRRSRRARLPVLLTLTMWIYRLLPYSSCFVTQCAGGQPSRAEIKHIGSSGDEARRMLRWTMQSTYD